MPRDPLKARLGLVRLLRHPACPVIRRFHQGRVQRFQSRRLKFSLQHSRVDDSERRRAGDLANDGIDDHAATVSAIARAIASGSTPYTPANAFRVE